MSGNPAPVFRRILVGYDGSFEAQAALRLALELAAGDDRVQVTAVAVVHLPRAPATVGDWTTPPLGPGYGFNSTTHTPGTGADTFTWRLNVPEAGTYDVQVQYPAADDAAHDAKFTISHAGGSTTKTVDESVGAGNWVSAR